MSSGFSLFLLYLWFGYCIISSILLFKKGFLLSRTTQTINSSCTFHESSNDVKINDLYNGNTVCLPAKSKVVLLLVDALRYDFTTYDDKIENPLPFQNKLPILNELLETHPESTRLYRFVADPPTTTMQRLKALTTGTLPTFIDAGSNFATYEINEDNLIDQLVLNGKKVVFMGDDTWNGLYPRRFLRNYPYPSFNVWDLDTVDDGVIDHIYDEIKVKDWDLLVAHFLGVDHCGHRYGPYHSEMARKLRLIDGVVRNISSVLDDNTMLVVLGDHGMTITGDHGGESSDEISSALFVYTKKLLTKTMKIPKEVKQIDIVPTLATILGVPIPFSSLGTTIFTSLPQSNDWKIDLHNLWSNIHQFNAYYRQLLKSGMFNKENSQNLNRMYANLEEFATNVYDERKFHQLLSYATNFMNELRKICEEVWIQFDSLSITRGLVLFFLTLFSFYMIFDGNSNEQLKQIFKWEFVISSEIIVIVVGLISFLLYYWEFVENLESTLIFSTGLTSQLIFMFVVIQNWENISMTWYDRSKFGSNLLYRFVLIFNVTISFSNSFILEESSVLLYLLDTIILLGSLRIILYEFKRRKPNIKFLALIFVLMTATRLTKAFWRCREEQQWCFRSSDLLQKQETNKLQWGAAVVLLALFVIATKQWLRHCGNMNGYRLSTTFVKYLPTVLVICIACFWVLNRNTLETKNKQVKYWQTTVLARIIYGMVSIGLIVMYLQPLTVYILPKRRGSIQEVFNDLMSRFKDEKTDETPVICGLGTVYSACYIAVAVYLTLLFALLLSDDIAVSAVLMTSILLSISVIVSINRIKTVTDLGQLLQVPTSSILAWMVTSQYFFYATGHQPAFPNIAWHAAFIGTPQNFTDNTIPALLVILNTFCAYIMAGVLLPLLLIVPYTLSVMVPTILKQSQIDYFKGEISLYLHDNLATTASLSLAFKYLVFHGIKVFMCMLAATVHCRHLMVWGVFAPKFIFEAIGLLVTLLSVGLGQLLFLRIHKKIDDLFCEINKKYSS